MMSRENLSRREFLKLSGAASISLAIPDFGRFQESSNLDTVKKNILIVVFDTLSALHLSLHGYSRETMPNLTRLADRAIVYHNHYSGGNYTTPGTASLLTGTLSWTHRAIVHNDTVADEFVTKNIFSSFSDYNRIAYSHNPLVNTLLKQFLIDIDDYTPREDLYLNGSTFVDRFFRRDEDIASVGWIRSIKRGEDGYGYSLFISQIIDRLIKYRIKNLEVDYPRGLPNINIDDYFVLEQGIDFLLKKISETKRPFLGYYHFLPPHAPYNPRKEFVGRFQNDGFHIKRKEEHIFSRNKTYQQLDKWSNYYDEFILNADYEFGRLFTFLDQNGILDDTWLIFTSDHGELFERGLTGHLTPLLYQPVIRVPLIIFEPGRNSRMDIYANTSGIDILPTLMKVSGKQIPDWIEGEVLPPFNDDKEDERNLFALQAKGIGKQDPIVKGTVMLVRDHHKLMYYFGYRELTDIGELLEVYDLKNDPDELNNLYLSNHPIVDELEQGVKRKLDEVNRPFISNS